MSYSRRDSRIILISDIYSFLWVIYCFNTHYVLHRLGLLPEIKPPSIFAIHWSSRTSFTTWYVYMEFCLAANLTPSCQVHLKRTQSSAHSANARHQHTRYRSRYVGGSTTDHPDQSSRSSVAALSPSRCSAGNCSQNAGGSCISDMGDLESLRSARLSSWTAYCPRKPSSTPTNCARRC